MRKLHIPFKNQIINHNSIRFKILFSFLLSLLISMLCIGFSAVFFSFRVTSDIMNEQTLLTLDQIKKNYEFQMERIEDISDIIYLDRINPINIQRYKNINELSFNYNEYKNVTDIINTIGYSNSYIQSISIITENDINLYFGEVRRLLISDIRKRYWYDEALKLSGKGLWLEPHISEDVYNSNKFILSYVRFVRQFATPKQELFEIINIKTDIFGDIFEKNKFTSNGNFFIVNEKGKSIYSKDSEAKFELNANQSLLESINNNSEYSEIVGKGLNKVLISSVKFESVPWNLVSVIPLNRLTAGIIKVNKIIILLIIANIIFVLFLEIKFTNIYLKPLNRLSILMKSIHLKHDYNKRIDETGSDEVIEISKSFNNLLSNTEDLMDHITKEQELKRKLEIKSLQSQIYPHFLYNTLNSINCIAEVNHQDDISKMIVALSNIFRLSIDYKDKFIEVKDEIDYLNNYLIIQKIRHRDKFKVEFQISRGIYDCKIIKLLLQPLLENSFKYGFSSKVHHITIKIMGNINNNTIIFNVVDNGEGMTEEQIKKINCQLSNNPVTDLDNDGKIGLNNVNDRIKLCFGQKYGLTLYNAYPQGLGVKITIPLVKGDENSDKTDNS